MAIRREKTVKQWMKTKQIGLIFLAVCMVLSVTIPTTISVEAQAGDGIIADWNFSKQFIQSGSLENGDLIIEDASGNENDLMVGTKGDVSDISNFLKWSDDFYDDKNNTHSMEFTNDKRATNGAYFATVADAPVNTETFNNGFTIEATFQLPAEFSPEKHAWMGMLTRQGQAADLQKIDGEKEMLSTLSVSNLRELQWTSHPTNLNYNDTNWSFSLIPAEWYHLAIVNDGKYTKLYINGVEVFRNTEEEMIGIAAVEDKGWNIGAAEWENELSTLFSGKISQIRIADQALNQSDWLFHNELGEHMDGGSNEDIPLLTDDDNYQFLFVPDPQKPVRYKPEIFHEQMDWLTKQGEANNIKMTAFLGDMVDLPDSTAEWEASNAGIDKLDGGNVSYLITAGNHDYGTGDPYLKYFGEDRFKDKDYFGESSPSGYSSYGIMAAGSYEYLFLMMDMYNMEEDIEWAKEILENNTTRPTILASHEILAISDDGKYAVDTERGNYLWDQLVNDNDQVFMTISGHNHGALHRYKQNANGNDVLQVLVDYQSDYAGGNGWMRFAEFNEQANQISFKTYSPWVETIPEAERTYFDVKYLTSENDMFTVELNFDERFYFAGEKEDYTDNEDKEDDEDNEETDKDIGDANTGDKENDETDNDSNDSTETDTDNDIVDRDKNTENSQNMQDNLVNTVNPSQSNHQSSGSTLPNTFTGTYNWLILGFGMILLGLLGTVLLRFRAKSK